MNSNTWLRLWLILCITPLSALIISTSILIPISWLDENPSNFQFFINGIQVIICSRTAESTADRNTSLASFLCTLYIKRTLLRLFFSRPSIRLTYMLPWNSQNIKFLITFTVSEGNSLYIFPFVYSFVSSTPNLPVKCHITVWCRKMASCSSHTIKLLSNGQICLVIFLCMLPTVHSSPLHILVCWNDIVMFTCRKFDRSCKTFHCHRIFICNNGEDNWQLAIPVVW